MAYERARNAYFRDMREAEMLGRLEGMWAAKNLQAGAPGQFPFPQGAALPIAPPAPPERLIAKLTARPTREKSTHRTAGKVFLCCATGLFDHKNSSLVLVTSLKSEPADSIENIPPLFVYYGGLTDTQELIIAPSVWEWNGPISEGGENDRAARLQELISASQDDIRLKLRTVKHINKPEPGKLFGFPSVSGSTEGNRPIGLKRTDKGADEFCPQVQMVNAISSGWFAEKGATIHYADDAATKLGGDYTLQLDGFIAR